MNTKSIVMFIMTIAVLIGTVTFTSTMQGVQADPKLCAGNPHDTDSGPSGNPHDSGEVGNPHDVGQQPDQLNPPNPEDDC